MFRVIAVGVLTTCLVAGCSSSRRTSATDAATPASAKTPAAVTSVSTSSAAKPLSWYADQYARLTKASNDALAAMNATPDQGHADQVVTALQAADAALLRASWPDAKTRGDLETLVRDDGPILGDLNDLAGNADQLQRDAGTANAQANIVRADLGLPPVQ